MADFKLILGNQTSSTWSMRVWLVMRQTGVPFDAEVIKLNTMPGQFELAQRSPNRMVPLLEHGDLRIWDSLAIIEYLAETFPEAVIWPKDAKARAVARSACAEMHAGFAPLRTIMPMNIGAPVTKMPVPRDVAGDIKRIVAIWTSLREGYGEGGPFLFGAWSAADAFFAPAVMRFWTYAVDLDDVCQAYADAVKGWPSVRQWISDAKTEAEIEK